MDAIRKVFADRKAENRPALITFVTAGYPARHDTVPILLAMQAGGADIIELGVPFSDPMADGPAIQETNMVALNNDIDYATVLLQLREARIQGLTAPVLLMGYYNPLLAYGEDKAVQDAADSDANGFIVVDLPPEEAVTFREKCIKFNISYIPLISPSTTIPRIMFLSSIADTFIYVVSKMGTTGSSDKVTINNALPEMITRVREHTSIPLAVGFGVATRDHTKQVAEAGADGVVIGSRLVFVIKTSSAGEIPKNVQAYCRDVCPMHHITRSSPASSSHSSSASLIKNKHRSSTINRASNPAALPTRFGEFGGQYVPEALVDCLIQLDEARKFAMIDPEFWKEFRSYYKYINRPSSLYFAGNLTREAGGARIWLKREDLNHTGSHHINSVVGQILLARRIGKTRIIADTGTGQHGIATATVCAKFGMECVVYMGTEDVRRHNLDVFQIEMLGGTVIPVHSGSCSLKDAVNEAMRDLVTNLATTYYLVGSVVGPHPFPTIVRDFQKVIGEEAKAQMKESIGKIPDAVVAFVGSGSIAMGVFFDFINDESTRLIGVEAGGGDIFGNVNTATLATGQPGVLHGVKTYLLQSKDGQILDRHSVNGGLDYPAVGPEHAWLKDCGRAEYVVTTDEEALRGFKMLTQLEGIVPALESSHAIWEAVRLAKTLSKEKDIVVCLSGRGGKDIKRISEILQQSADKFDWNLSVNARQRDSL